MFASTGRALDQWNVAVKRAAVIGQMADSKRVGEDPTYLITGSDGNALPVEANGYPSEDTISADKSATGGHVIPDVFVLCHNPVIDADDPSCGPAGTKARVGDIRYNMVNIINTPQTGSPWGIMVDANDPLTGEKVQTSVNEWGAVLDYAAQATEDLLRWINGEITDDANRRRPIHARLGQRQQARNGQLPAARRSRKTRSSIASASSTRTLNAGNGLTAADASAPALRSAASQGRARTSRALQRCRSLELDVRSRSAEDHRHAISRRCSSRRTWCKPLGSIRRLRSRATQTSSTKLRSSAA